MHVRVREENVSALTFGSLEPQRTTLCSKHYVIKYHWCCEQIQTRKIELIKIASADQLGDIFTKGLSRIIIEGLQKKLMGW